MRITFITLKIDIVVGGGANRGLDIKLRSLQARGHEVKLLTIFPELNRLPPEGVPYSVLAEPCKDRGFRALQKHAVSLLTQYENQTDVYHIDGTTCMWAGGMYRKAGGSVPTVVYLPTYAEALNLLPYEAPDPFKGFMPWLKFHIDVRMVWFKHWLWAKFVGIKYIHHLDKIFGDSPVLCENYVRFGFPKDKFEVMPEFVDASHFLDKDVQGSAIPDVFNAERSFHLLHVGRLLRMKGVDLLIQAVAGLRRGDRNVTATVLGNGPQLERLQKLAQKLGVKAAVTFLPWTEESALAPTYASCDAFVHPCRFPEPFGRTILEALFFHRPIVTTEHSGSAWVAGNAGKTIKMNNAADLERVLAELYDHPPLLKKLLNAAPERVAFFNHDHWTRVLEQSLQKLITR